MFCCFSFNVHVAVTAGLLQYKKAKIVLFFGWHFDGLSAY